MIFGGSVGEDYGDELVELDGSVAVGIHSGEEGVDLVAGELEAEGSEEGGELEQREAAVGVHVEAGEDLLQLVQLIRVNRVH